MAPHLPQFWGLTCPPPRMTDLRLWASLRGTQWGPPRVSPALRRDQGVAHVQDAHVWVALHVLLPVHVVVLDHICTTEGTV